MAYPQCDGASTIKFKKFTCSGKVKNVLHTLDFAANTDHSIHAGLVAVEAMARRFGLWEKVRALKCLGPAGS